MTTTKETCPKCGEAREEESSTGLITWFKCDSSTRKANDRFVQSDRCRITELERENARLREAAKPLAERIRFIDQTGIFSVPDRESVQVNAGQLRALASTLLAKGGKTE